MEYERLKRQNKIIQCKQNVILTVAVGGSLFFAVFLSVISGKILSYFDSSSMGEMAPLGIFASIVFTIVAIFAIGAFAVIVGANIFLWVMFTKAYASETDVKSYCKYAKNSAMVVLIPSALFLFSMVKGFLEYVIAMNISYFIENFLSPIYAILMRAQQLKSVVILMQVNTFEL